MYPTNNQTYQNTGKQLHVVSLTLRYYLTEYLTFGDNKVDKMHSISRPYRTTSMSDSKCVRIKNISIVHKVVLRISYECVFQFQFQNC